MRLAGITCSCGSEDLFAVFPGQEPQGVDTIYDLAVREEATAAWCYACWIAGLERLASRLEAPKKKARR